MKLKYLLLFLLSSVSLLTTPLLSSDKITLDQCINWGLERNPSLQSVTLEKQLDLPASLAAWGQFLPSVSTSFSIEQSKYYYPTFVLPDGSVATRPDSLISEGRNRNSAFYLRVDETLFRGGRNYFNFKNTVLNEKIRNSRLKYERSLLRSQITRAFSNAIAADRWFDLAGKVIEQRRLQLHLAQVRFETGSVTRRDVLQAEVDLGRARSDSLSALFDAKRTSEELNILIDLPLDTTYTLAKLTPPFKIGWDIDSLITEGRKARGDIVSTELTVQMTNNDRLSAKGEYLPALTTSYYHRRSEQSGINTAFTLKPRSRYSQVGLTISWNLFDRFTRELRLQEARVRQQQAEFSVYENSRDIQHQVRVAADRLFSLYEQAEVAAQNSHWAEETLKFEQERYRLGSATIIELGAAQLSFIQAKNDQIRLETEFYTALGELELATGIVLR
ncbi:MAG: TolC family protein [Candidatus Hatepunaea meridiana]|nr:TolC family protein [Candidatus Hatepunaea meridiana]